MNILHLVGGLGTSSGTTQIIWNLCRVAADAGHRTSILYLTGRGIDTWELPDKRIDTYPCPISWSRSWGFSPAFYKTLKRLSRSASILHVHSNWLYINLAASGVALRHGIPLVISPQGALDPWCLRRHSIRKLLYWQLLERRIMQSAAAIHAVSDFEHANVRVMGIKTPCHVIPNGAIPPATMPDRMTARRSLGLDPSCHVSLFLARLNPKKGLDLVIKAAATIPANLPFHLLVAGSDGGSGYREQLHTLAKPLSDAGRITWLGEVSGAQKTAAFAAADHYVLPSHAEGMPVSTLEAMAHGLPVLISEACHLPETLTAGAGLQVDLTPESIAARMIELIQDSERCRRMGVAAQALVEARFTWPVIGRAMHDLYTSILA